MRRFALLLLPLLLVSCGYVSDSPDPSRTDFYSGTNGVDARFDHVPNRLFFYRDPGPAGNSFEVGVEVKNNGGSWSRGAVFLSGYDPALIRFDEVPVGQYGAVGGCGFSIDSFGYGELAGIFSCDDLAVGGTSFGDFFVDMPSFRSFAERMGWETGGVDFSVQASQVADHKRFSMSFFENVDMEYWGHGRLMTGLFSGIDFRSVLGRPYVLPGRSYEYPSGGVEYLSYHGEVLSSGWPPGLDEIRQTLLLTNCYLYTTHAAPLVCIDPRPDSEVDKVCRARQHTFSGSQGAPVAITSIEHEGSPRNSVFRFHIQNVGSGEVFDPGMIQKCSPYVGDRVRPEDKDVVFVGDVRIGNTRLTNCVPDGLVRLQNGRGTFTCNYPYAYAGSQNAYETPLYVELWYGYSDTQRRTVTVKRVS